MKTTLGFIITLIFAAISASAWAMPCARNAGGLQEVRDAQHQVRLHVAQQAPTTDPASALHPAPFKVPGHVARLPV